MTGVVGRAELLSSIFFLLSIQAYTDTSRQRYKIARQTDQCTGPEQANKQENKAGSFDLSVLEGTMFSSLLQVPLFFI